MKFEYRVPNGMYEGRDLVNEVDATWVKQAYENQDWEGSPVFKEGTLLDGQLMTEEVLTAAYNKVVEPDLIALHAKYRKYPDVTDQLDMIYKEVMATGVIAADGEWAAAITAVKDAVPKQYETPYVETSTEEDTTVE